MENAALSFQFTKQIGHSSTSGKNTGDIKKLTPIQSQLDLK
jgi:hypothetical protein